MPDSPTNQHHPVPFSTQATHFRQLMTLLARMDDREKKILATLDSIQESLHLSIVFHHRTPERETILCSTSAEIPNEDLHNLAESTLRSRPPGVAFALKMNGSVKVGGDPVSSMVVVPTGKPGEWIFAITHTPDRILGQDELSLVHFAATLLNKQFQQDVYANSVKASLLSMVRCLSTIIDAKDSCTSGHSDRVGQIAARIGRALRLPAHEINALRLGGLVHDIGKIGIRDEVLLKPGKLTAEDREHIQLHPLIGDEIISKISYFAKLRPAVRSHHERMDGKGYPDRLQGDAIPMPARIIAVADTVDALMSPRCYRREMAPPQIDDILLKFAGAQWDRRIVEAFMDCREDIYPPIYKKPVGDTAMHAISDLVDEMMNNSSTHYKLLG